MIPVPRVLRIDSNAQNKQEESSFLHQIIETMETLQFFAPLLVIVSSITSGLDTLTIDNQLVIIANDCYTRIAIGSTLPSKDIASTVIAATVTECEDECSRKRSTCEIFSFGISAKGNASCLLGTRIPNPEDLTSNSDYDIYIRQQSSPHCMPDRLYKLGSGKRNPTNLNNDQRADPDRDQRNRQNDTARRPKPEKRPTAQNIIPGPGGFGTVIISRPSDERVVSSVVNIAGDNHETYQNHPNYQIPEVNPHSPGYDEDNPNGPYTYANKNPYEVNQNGYGPNAGNGGGHKVQGNDQNFDGGYESGNDEDLYHGEHEIPGDGNNDDRYFYNLGESGHRYGTNVYETPATISCYRKLFAGKRLAEIHVRRAIDCEQVEECSKQCDSERGFSCEGFNYRHQGTRGTHHPPRGRSHGICELTAMPPSQIDVVRDILNEPRYDYYERDTGCPNKRPYRPSQMETGWINVRPSPPQEDDRPYFQRPIEIPRPLQQVPDRRPNIDVPRPLLGNDYPPKRPFHDENLPPSYFRPDSSYPRRVPPINIRPIEDDVRYEYYGPSGRPYFHGKEEIPNRPDSSWYRPQPHDFGTNEIEPYNQPGRRKDSVRGWGGGHGLVYGGSYGYKTNYIDQLHDVPTRGNFLNHDKRPFRDNNDGIYSQVYSYGGAFGYGDNYAPANRDVIYGGSRRPEVCSLRSGAGFKLRRGIVRKSYLTPSLDHCENLCAVEKDCICMTFSYRYSIAANAPTDNCLLSEISYRDLDFYNDLEPDRDYDIYSMTGDLQSCGMERPVSQRPPEECFWRVRSGCGVPPEVVRKTIVAQGLGDCEAECVESRLFTCRSFVYRDGEIQSFGGERAPNCFLSDWPSLEIDPLSLSELEGAELYQRGSFGRGCEPFPFPPLNHRRRRPDNPENRPAKKDEVCYAEYKKPCRLTPDAVILTIFVDSEYECRKQCSEMRERDPVPCMSFSYRLSSDRDEHNCFMSDVPRRDLRPGIDYIFGDGHLLFAWNEFEPQCDSGYSIGIFIDEERDDDRGKRPGYYFGHNSGGASHFEPPFAPEPRPGRHRYPSPSDFEDHRPGERPFGHGNDGGYHLARPLNPDRPDPAAPHYGSDDHRGPTESNGFYGGGGGGGGGSFHETDGRFGHGYSDDRYNDFSYKHAGSTFQHFTVNGHPCKRGTRCERNKVAGFWSCEPEGGEYGTWDYCCEPKHHCGYSQGYHYPWCYVGPFEDQWRPCSAQYYPYLPSHRPARPSSDRYDEEDAYGEVPRPGSLGRHWPVAYLHREAPPNVTDSFASGDRRKNRELQNVISSNKDGITRESWIVRKTSNASSLRAESTQNYIRSDLSDDPVPPKDFRKESHPAITSGNARSAKIERVTRLSHSQRENGSNDREIDEIVRLKDLIEGDDNADVAAKFNETSSRSADRRGTTFVRLPTISSNKTEGSSFQDYFEVVNVE